MSCPDSVRAALATLPWVEQRTIEPDRRTLFVRFGINDRSAYSEDDMRRVLGSKYSKGMTVKEVVDRPAKAATPTTEGNPEKS